MIMMIYCLLLVFLRLDMIDADDGDDDDDDDGDVIIMIVVVMFIVLQFRGVGFT